MMLRRGSMTASRWAVRASTARQSSRLFSTVDKKPEETKPLTVQEFQARRLNGVNWHLDHPVYSSGVAEPAPEGAMVNTDGITSLMPAEVRDSLVVRIFKPAKNAMQNAREGTKVWRMEPEHNNERWMNMLQGYWSGGDPIGATGLRNISFNTREEAVSFAERNGWNFFVDDPLPNQHIDQAGKKAYAANFLNYHVQARRARWTPKKLSQVHFKHPERGQTCWVNLKHSNFGAAESKQVSGTQWSNPHPKNHHAKNWHMKSLAAKQELARKLGK